MTINRRQLLGNMAAAAGLVLSAPAVLASTRQQLLFVPAKARNTKMLVAPEDVHEFNIAMRDISYGNVAVRMDEDLHAFIREVAAHFGVDEIGVNSGYRTPEHQRRINSDVPNSAHCLGKAGDLKFLRGGKIISHREVQKYAVSLKRGGVGFYNTFTHLDTAGVRDWRVN